MDRDQSLIEALLDDSPYGELDDELIAGIDLEKEATYIPRHPQNSDFAYGYNLDPALIKPMIEERLLAGAFIRDFVTEQERRIHVTERLENGFRKACGYFRNDTYANNHDAELAVMRLMGFDNQGIFPQVSDYEPREKGLDDFLGTTWMREKMDAMSIWPMKKLGEYGFHIVHAFEGAVEEGLAPRWHGHGDITVHLTLKKGGGVECLPRGLDIKDVRRSPEKYESQILAAKAGELAIVGPEVLHRTTSTIKRHGQFAMFAGGPLASEYENS